VAARDLGSTRRYRERDDHNRDGVAVGRHATLVADTVSIDVLGVRRSETGDHVVARQLASTIDSSWALGMYSSELRMLS